MAIVLTTNSQPHISPETWGIDGMHKKAENIFLELDKMTRQEIANVLSLVLYKLDNLPISASRPSQKE